MGKSTWSQCLKHQPDLNGFVSVCFGSSLWSNSSLVPSCSPIKNRDMSVSGDDDDLPTCECGQTMTIKKSEKMWHCSVCQEVKAACVLQYICACGRHTCDECAWFNAEYADEIEEECEEEYEEWDEYCEIGGYDSWNGCDQYQHQEEGQWQEWEHKGHSPDESEEHGEQNESGAWKVWRME